jgi:elongator complex protein 2
MNTVNVNVVDLANEVKDDEEEDDELTEKKDNHDVIDIETIEEITMSEARLTFFGHNCSHNIYLEALMIGHEDWVTHVQWLTDYTPLSTKSSHESAIPSDLRLFSTSMDRNMLIWKADESTGIWTPQVRIGDIGGLLGGCVGANLLGFVGGCVIPQNNAVLGIGYGGSFHLWCRLDETIYQHHTNRKEVILESWRPIPFLTGHFDMVKDLQWSFDGEFIMTTSSDQTCRLFAPMNYSLVIDFTSTNCLQKTTSDHEMKSWHEISRPQIHGYDLNSVQILSSDPYNDQYIIFTAGDEKIIRQFEASLCVIETLKSLCNIGNPSGESMKMSSKRYSIWRPFLSYTHSLYLPESIEHTYRN